MKRRLRWILIGCVAVFTLVAVPTASASVDAGEVVTHGCTSDGCGFVVEDLSGDVTALIRQVNGAAYGHFTLAGDGSIVGDGEEGPVWLTRPDGQAVELDASPNDFDASISYDGSKVVFSRYDVTTGASDIYVVDSDGSGLALVADGGGNNYLSSPRFSPDGGSIAYACTAATHASEDGLGCGPTVEGTYHLGGVMLMNADGTDKRLILLGGGDDAEPVDSVSWSADGQWLTFSACVNVVVGPDTYTCDPEQIYAYRTDGSDLFNNLDASRQVTHETGIFGGFLPQFCGDSTHILYLKTVDDNGNQGNFSYVIDRDGANRHELSLSSEGRPWGQCVPPSTGGGPAPTVDVVPPIDTRGQLVLPSWASGWLPQCVGFVVEAPDGHFTRCLAISAGADTPSYAASADGTVAFVDATKGGWGDGGPLSVVHPDGTVVELDSSPDDAYPSISHDGSKVAFARVDPATGLSGIYVVNSDGSDLTLLASGGGTTAGPDYPEFSPDGGSIAYSDGPNEMVMNADGSNKRAIVDLAGGVASWSPDGQWLAMTGCVTASCATQQVFVYRTDGSDLLNALDPDRQVTHLDTGVDPFSARFTPDGGQILFSTTVDASGKTGDFRYLVNPDGTDEHETSLTPDPPVCQAAAGCFPQPPSGEYVPLTGGGGPSPTVKPTQATVPNVHALALKRAKTRLAAVRMRAKVTRHSYSSRIRRGHVISQYPKPRAQARLGKNAPVVKLVLSRGKRPKAKKR